MQLNFFAWLREGVRQSILLGVSDAVEEIGSPDEKNALGPKLLASARNAENLSGPKKAAGARKRLGRSLKDTETSE